MRPAQHQAADRLAGEHSGAKSSPSEVGEKLNTGKRRVITGLHLSNGQKTRVSVLSKKSVYQLRIC